MYIEHTWKLVWSSPPDQKNTTNERWVMVSWMEVRCSNMVGALIWELVYQC